MKDFWGRGKSFLSGHVRAILIEVLLVVTILGIIMAFWCRSCVKCLGNVRKNVFCSYEKAVEKFSEFEESIESMGLIEELDDEE